LPEPDTNGHGNSNRHCDGNGTIYADTETAFDASAASHPSASPYSVR
jgi:hypothetical protein